jgi:glycosyltransferase involved in cell wall biosynthesis
MKIIHAHKYFYLRAGAERYMLSLMRYQEEMGHTVAPFAMHHEKNLRSPWEDYFVSELETESADKKPLQAIGQIRRALWSSEAYRKMRELIGVFEPDIVHVHNLYTHLSPSVLAACKKSNVPVVMSVHDYALASANYALWGGEEPMDLDHLGWAATTRSQFIKDSKIATAVLDAIYRWHRFRKSYDKHVDRYLVSSRFLRTILIRAGYPENKIELLPLYADEALPKTKRSDKGSVLFFGRLEYYKGVQTLIEAMRSFPETKLDILGAGSYEKTLWRLAKENDLINFHGFQKGKDLASFIARARVVVVPSIWYEPFGLVAVEAMRAGVPVIVSDRGGLPEIVEEGISGEIFHAGDVQDLVDKLQPILRDKDLARSMGEAAALRAEEVAAPQPHLERLFEIYNEVINNASEV